MCKKRSEGKIKLNHVTAIVFNFFLMMAVERGKGEVGCVRVIGINRPYVY